MNKVHNRGRRTQKAVTPLRKTCYSKKAGSAFFGILLSCCLILRPVSAQFGRAATQPWSGGVTVANKLNPRITAESALKVLQKEDPFRGPLRKTPAPAPQPPTKPTVPQTASVNLMPIMTAKWQAARESLSGTAAKFLNERDIGNGWRTSKNRLTLASTGPLFVGTDGSGCTIKLKLPGNSLVTWLRTPTGVSEDADPGFEVTFDLEVTIDLDIRGNRIVAGPARIRALVQKPVGTNATGSAALVAANLLKDYLGGPDFVGDMLKVVHGNQFAFDAGINQELAKLNPILDKAAAGVAIHPDYDPATKNITLTLVNAGPAPVVR